MLPNVLASPCKCPSNTSWHPWDQRLRLGCRGSKRGWAWGSESWLCRQGLGEWGLQQEKGTPSIRYRPSTLLWIRLQREGQGVRISGDRGLGEKLQGTEVEKGKTRETPTALLCQAGVIHLSLQQLCEMVVLSSPVYKHGPRAVWYHALAPFPQSLDELLPIWVRWGFKETEGGGEKDGRS